MIGWKKFEKEEDKLKMIWNFFGGRKWFGIGVASLKAGTKPWDLSKVKASNILPGAPCQLYSAPVYLDLKTNK